MKTYCVVSFEDVSTGEVWDYGAYSVFTSLNSAKCAVLAGESTYWLDCNIYKINDPNGPYIATFKPDLTRAECELLGKFDYPT